MVEAALRLCGLHAMDRIVSWFQKASFARVASGEPMADGELLQSVLLSLGSELAESPWTLEQKEQPQELKARVHFVRPDSLDTLSNMPDLRRS